MTSREIDNQEWEENRVRIDSLCASVFLISGGALSVSIGLAFSNPALLEQTPGVSKIISWAWWLLVYPIIACVLLKANIIIQKYMLLEHPKFHRKARRPTNWIGWVLGISGVSSFCVGMVNLVRVAQKVVS